MSCMGWFKKVGCSFQEKCFIAVTLSPTGEATMYKVEMKEHPLFWATFFFFSSLGIIHWRMDCLHECCTTSQKGAVISARTSRCYCNTINNKMSPMPKQKKDENNISKIRNLLLVVENMLSCGSSQRRKNFLKPYPSQKLSFDEGKMQEIDAWFCFSFFNSAGYQPTKDLWELERKTECGNNARHG